MAGRLQVSHGHRLRAETVVADGHQDQPDLAAVRAGQGLLQRGKVDVALERCRAVEIGRFRARQVPGLRADQFDIGVGGIEMSVAKADLPGREQTGEEHALAGPALVHRQDERIPGEVVNLVVEAEPRPGTSVRLVA